MPDPAALANQNLVEAPQEVVEATIVKTPASIESPVQVLIPDVSEGHLGLVEWTPKALPAGIYFPHEGDRCWVARTGQFEKALITWELSGEPDVFYSPKGAKGVVIFGEEASTPRPEGFDSVEWIGIFEPLNAIDNDTWVNPGRE